MKPLRYEELALLMNRTKISFLNIFTLVLCKNNLVCVQAARQRGQTVAPEEDATSAPPRAAPNAAPVAPAQAGLPPAMAQADAEWAAVGGGLLPAEVQRLGSLGEDGAKDLITAALDSLGPHEEIHYDAVLKSSVNDWGEYLGYVRTLVRDGVPLPEHRGVAAGGHPPSCSGVPGPSAPAL